MYYKEEWINGKLCWKATPNGEWIPFTIGQYKDRVLKLEAELKNLHKANVIKSVCGKDIKSCPFNNNGNCMSNEHCKEQVEQTVL